MNTVKTVVTSVCCGAFLCGTLSLCLSDKSVSNTVKFLLSLFLSACLVLPILKVDFSKTAKDFENFDADCSVNTGLSSLVNSQTAAVREKAAAAQIQSLAENLGVGIISLSFERDGYARVVVSRCENEKKEKLKSDIYDFTGISAEVTE